MARSATATKPVQTEMTTDEAQSENPAQPITSEELPDVEPLNDEAVGQEVLDNVEEEGQVTLDVSALEQFASEILGLKDTVENLVEETARLKSENVQIRKALQAAKDYTPAPVQQSDLEARLERVVGMLESAANRAVTNRQIVETPASTAPAQRRGRPAGSKNKVARAATPKAASPVVIESAGELSPAERRRVNELVDKGYSGMELVGLVARVPALVTIAKTMATRGRLSPETKATIKAAVPAPRGRAPKAA